MYAASLHGIDMQQLSDQYTGARALVAAARTHDWRRGFTYTYLLLAAGIWLVTFLALLYFAQRISHPIRELTKGLSEVAAGHMDHRVPEGRTWSQDEIGTAVRAFNNMAEELKQSQERLVYVTRLESWQALARKMAHEVKNSLTPIRLTMEEIAARQSGSGGEFYEQAAQIVVDEVTEPGAARAGILGILGRAARFAQGDRHQFPARRAHRVFANGASRSGLQHAPGGRSSASFRR